MENYIIKELKTLCDEHSTYFLKILDILENPNPKNNEYVEKHHIIPRSINEKLIKDKNNIIELSMFNHIMIHWYYYKCAKDTLFKYKNGNAINFVIRHTSKQNKYSEMNEDEIKTVAKIVEQYKNDRYVLSDDELRLLGESKSFLCLENNKIYKNKKYCSRKLGINNIQHVLTGKISSSNGYHFIYCDDERLKTMTNEEIINDIEETIRKRRKELKQYMYTDDWKNKISKSHNGREFVCLENGNKYTNQTLCCKEYDLSKSILCNMLNKHKYHLTSKYHFIYVDELNGRTYEQCLKDIKKFVQETNGNINRYNAKQVICYETNVIYKSTSEAERKTKIIGIARACLHESYSAGGYHWFFVNEDIDRDEFVKNHPIREMNNRIVCLETKEIFENVKIASEKLNVSKAMINNVCRGTCKTTKGYHFLYEKDYLKKSESEILTILNMKSTDEQNKMKSMYRKMISDGSWSKDNHGWNRFQKYYKEIIDKEKK